MSISAFGFRTANEIRFGRGTRSQAAKAVRHFGRRVVLVRGRSVAWVDTLHEMLKAEGCAVVEVVCTQEPSLPILNSALETSRIHKSDVVLAVGGGAVIDLGKAVAALTPGESAALDHLESVGAGRPLESDPLPFVALPTTAGAGAELTKNAVILVPEAGRKVSLRDDRMLPDLALVDPELTDNSPRGVTLASGLDAVTQVIEPYLSNRPSALTDALCRDAIPKGLSALAVLAEREDSAARDEIAYTSMISGMVLANSGLGAVHGLAGVLGGRLHAPHGLICGRLLGPVLEANYKNLAASGQDTSRFEEVADWISQALPVSSDAPLAGLSRLLDEWDVSRLRAWIDPDADLFAIAAEAAGSSSMKANPCVLSEQTLVDIVKQAI